MIYIWKVEVCGEGEPWDEWEINSPVFAQALMNLSPRCFINRNSSDGFRVSLTIPAETLACAYQEAVSIINRAAGEARQPRWPFLNLTISWQGIF